MEWLRLKGTFGGHLFQPPCSSMVELAAEDHVQMTCEYLHGWKLHDLFRQPVAFADEQK